MIDKLVSIQIETPGFIIGRNGTFDITAIRLWQGFGKYCYLDGIGKRGSPIRGGLQLSTEVVDRLANEWLLLRGWYTSGGKTGPLRLPALERDSHA